MREILICLMSLTLLMAAPAVAAAAQPPPARTLNIPPGDGGLDSWCINHVVWTYVPGAGYQILGRC